MQQDSVESELSLERVGPYRLETPLGEGGMGTIWRAWDERLRRHVAIKRVQAAVPAVAQGRERLRREARAAARLSHPSIVRIYDLIEREDGEWIVMELVPGRTLRELIDESGPLDPGHALRLAVEIAGGLAEAHAAGILHRDLKTSNIMVTPAGRARILDFGLAKELPREKGVRGEHTLTQAGTVVGTCYAMSPEQVMGKPLDGRSDLFSFGTLLYEMLTGSPPFQGATPNDSLVLVLNRRLRPLLVVRPDCPAELSVLVEQLLEKNPELRPRSAREVAKALSDLAVATSGELETEVLLQLPESTEETAVQMPMMRRAPKGGARRSLTVLCCGLVGLDAAGKARFLDVETLDEAMAWLQDLAQEVAAPLGGVPGSMLGQSLWLGFPDAGADSSAALEEGPRRAVQAALDLVARVTRLGGPETRQRFALRAAVHTGAALIQERPGAAIQLQPGATLDVAMGLQAVIPPASVVVSADSRGLLGDRFALEPLPPVDLPGHEGAVEAWRVVG
jgi:serine/threonine-protein kinase